MPGLYRGVSGLAPSTGLWGGSPGLWDGATGLQDGGGFSPLSLFAASEPGFWYDPSDLTTLFQDTAGTTPVTAAGQSVGLVLDKSKGLVRGPELVTNGDFSNGATGWMLGSGWSISGGSASIDGSNAAASSLTQTSIVTVVGRAYQIQFEYTVTSGRIRLNTAQFGTTASLTAGASGVFRSVIAATGSTGSFSIQAQDAGTIATVDNISVRELPGNHATQSTSLSRPTYQIDSNRRGYLSFDGSDDSLVTGTITPGTDKVQVFAGVRKLSDAAQGVVADWGVPAAAGGFTLQAPSVTGVVNRYLYTQYGSAAAALPFITDAAYAAPHTAVFTGYGDIAADVNIARINGVQAATSTTDQGTGNFSSAACYIGRRNGSTLPFNGRLYGLITRFGPNLTAEQIAQTEAWVNSKTGAY